MRTPPLRIMVAGLAAALAGCGVPTEGEAEVADPEAVPFGLLDEDREPVAGRPSTDGTAVEVHLYDDEEEAVVAVQRTVGDPTIAAIVDELEETPTDAESRDGLRSPLAEVDAVASVEVEAGLAVVELSEAFREIGGSDQLIALAQIVYTATGRPGVGQVSFELDGTPIEIPVGDGTLTSQPVTRRDYAAVASGAR